MEPDTDDPAAAWREGLDYRITVDLAKCHFDADDRLLLHGEIANTGTQAIRFDGDPRGVLRIGARLRSGAEIVRDDARAIPSSSVVTPGERAAFRMRLAVDRIADAPSAVELSLVCEGRFWFCDLSFASLTIATNREGRPDPDANEAGGGDIPPNDLTPTPITGALRDYYRARIGGGPAATLDDVWNCYRLLLDRVPDPGGFDRFADAVRDGMPVGTLVEQFVASEEFARRLARPSAKTSTTARIGGLDLHVPAPRTTADRDALSNGHTKPHLAGAMSSVLATDQFVVDIGAGFGEFTTLAARRVGTNGRVIALEPDPRSTRLLLANVTQCAFANVDVLPFCAADGDGFVTLSRSGSMLIARDVSHEDLTSDVDALIVYARTLDSVIPIDQRVDVLKIALDGYDHRAMLGAKALLSRWRPHLFGDFAPGLLHEFSGIAPEEYLTFLRGCGYDHFTAISRDHGPIEIGDDIGKLAGMPGRLGAASVDFYATIKGR